MRGGLGLAAALATVVTALVLGGAGASASSPTVHSAIGLPLIGSSHSTAVQSAGKGATANAIAADTSKASNNDSSKSGGDPNEKVCKKKEHEEGTPAREHEPKKCHAGNGDDNQGSG